MARVFIIIGALLALAGVAAGAFGAHTLRDSVTADQLEIWKTAATYQMWHALGTILVGLLIAQQGVHTHPLPASPEGGGEKTSRAWTAAGWLFVAGVVVFSGSLYALVLSDMKWLGAITPLGGVAFMVGWLCVAIGTWRNVRLK